MGNVVGNKFDFKNHYRQWEIQWEINKNLKTEIIINSGKYSGEKIRLKEQKSSPTVGIMVGNKLD